MTSFVRPVLPFALFGLAGLVSADQRRTQVHIDVRFVEATSESLRDIGADIGWGGGVSIHFGSDDRAAAIPFIGASWDRMTGDQDFRSDISGAQFGFRIRMNPNAPLEKSQTSFVVAEGYYRNRHRDEAGSETSQALGFDIGLEVGPAMGSKSPLWRFLYSQRPKTFGKTTQLMVVSASFPVSIK